jgi:DNA polymerase-3 subunit epsilon
MTSPATQKNDAERPDFITKHWACSRSDIDWKAEGIRSSALEFVAYSLGFFHDGHRAASDCRATLHALAQPLPGTRRLALQALLEQARLPTWRLWARDAAIEKKDVLKTRGYAWSPGEFSAGIAMCQTRIRRQRCRGSEQT